MTILYFLIGCSILVALVFLAAFFWSIRSGQHDDMHTPAIRILFEDDKPEEKIDPLSLKKPRPTESQS